MDHYKAIIPLVLLFFESEVEKGLFCHLIFSPEPVDGFQKFKWLLEAEKHSTHLV